MKKNYFLGALIFYSSLGFSQKTLILNGGIYGVQTENANLMIYDNTSTALRVVDTIQTQSVQEIIIDGDYAYAAAQDSIVKYELITEQRVAASKFNGFSTKALAITQNELLVGNWYGKSSDNLYIYNKSTLVLVDSISALNKGVQSILVNNGFAYVTQNSQTANYEDTLGLILKINIASRTITDTIRVSGYSGEFGELVINPARDGFIALNSGSNTITRVDFANLSAANNVLTNHDLRVSSRSNYTEYNDTLFIRMDNGIGALNRNTLQFHANLIVDTVVTAFSYDTHNHQFRITQTNYFSYQQGQVYGRNGVKIRNFAVGYSPEVVRIYYPNTLGFNEFSKNQLNFQAYPNPANELLNIETSENATLSILDLSGRLVKEVYTPLAKKMDVSDLPIGMYLIQLKTGSKLVTQKLLIQR